MKKIIYMAAAIVAALTASSCSKEFAGEISGGEINDGDYLVIKADCPEFTKTDISSGKTSWEAGDKITVVYEGTAYTYETAVAGSTAVFTSTNGITSYDASKPLVAYYPETEAAGTISIPAAMDITLDSNGSAPSRTPLVGTSIEGSFADGSIKLTFANVFSTMELIVDGGEIADNAKTLTIEPQGEMTGYLAATGTVDPATLAFTAASTSNTLTINLNGADLTKQMDIKFPVGRFSSSEGLKVTVETVSGEKLVKYIYKSGLTTFAEANGKVTLTHFSKPMYAFTRPGSIKTMEDFNAFVAAVNSGASTGKWENTDGVIVLETDLDFSSVTEWSPVGNASINWASNTLTITGNPFRGRFDGGNHSIKNLKMVCQNDEAGKAFGFFGVVSGAEIKNLVFTSDCSLESKPSALTDCGVVAGVVFDSKLSNIINNAPMNYSGTVGKNVRSTLGMVGFAFADKGVVIDLFTNYGEVTAEAGANTGNGAGAVQVAGICGFSTNANGSTNYSTISNCVNHAEIGTSCARASGIVAAANRYTLITGCTNYGRNTNYFTTSGGARLGNITCITGTGSKIVRTKNYGDLISSTSAPAGGIVCLVNDDSCAFENVENYGAVVTDKTGGYVGTFFGQCNKAATFVSCVSAGKFGTFNNGEFRYVDITAENYFDYIGSHSAAATGVSKETIRYTAE